MLTGAQTIDNANYFFSPEGIRMTGMVAREDGSYYYDPASGQMVTGWFNVADKTCYADTAGHVVTGAYEIEKQLYFFDAEGALIRNQVVELDGVAYNASPEGVLTPVAAPAAEETPEPAAEAAPKK